MTTSGSTPNTAPRGSPNREWRALVVAGVLRDPAGRILLAKRPQGKHLAGLWEFPGGKMEPEETVEEALRRELQEELGIEVLESLPLIEVHHAYPEKTIRLKIFEVVSYRGTPRGLEGQELGWWPPEMLEELPLPEADRPVVKAVQLPAFGVILEGLDDYEGRFELLLDRGVRLIYLRARNRPPQAYRELTERLLPLLEQNPKALLMVRDASLPPHPQLVLHLDDARLQRTHQRPREWRWLSAACHSLAKLKRAEKVGVDFALLAPIEKTPTHPEAQPIGWEKAACWLRAVNFPVYLLGGMVLSDWKRARRIGAQGVFGIRLVKEIEVDRRHREAL